MIWYNNQERFFKLLINVSVISLRAIGAFTVYGSEIYKSSCELKNWDIPELEKCVDTYLEHFFQSVQMVTIDDFISNIENPMYHKELREALTFVHNHKYLEALNCLNELGDG